ncbi:Aldehyde/histidinol dehydrogenase, partial [Baffinella frigidus]
MCPVAVNRSVCASVWYMQSGWFLLVAVLASLSGAAAFAAPLPPARFAAARAASRPLAPPASKRSVRSGAPGRLKMGIVTAKKGALSDAPLKFTEKVQAEITEKLRVLDGNKKTWAEMPVAKKIQYLDDIESQLKNVDLGEWVKGTTAIHGFVRPDDMAPMAKTVRVTESFLSSSFLLSVVRKIRTTMREQQASGAAGLKPLPIRKTATGDAVVKVYPYSAADKYVGFGGMGVTGEIWLEDSSVEEAAREYPTPPDGGRVSLVLGAGNQVLLELSDVLDRLFIQGEVVMTKHHELRLANEAPFAIIFAKLIRDGFVAATTGDGATGAFLVNNDLVGHVHITGGLATANKIIWGATAEEQARRKAASDPVLKKPISTELGNISPFIVSPGGDWTDDDLKFQAAHLAAIFSANNSCNCLSPKVLVLAAEWEHRQAFLAHLRQELSLTKQWPPYYPGTKQRYQAFKDHYPEAESLGAGPGVAPNESGEWLAGPGVRNIGAPLPFLLIDLADGGAKGREEYCLNNEAFAPVLAIASIPGDATPRAFAAAASDFCNDKVMGSLTAAVILHPTLEAADTTIADVFASKLRYGGIGINTAGQFHYMIDTLPWGAHPGETLDALESGQGYVKNTLGVKGVRKSVVRFPFRSPVIPTREAVESLPDFVPKIVLTLAKGLATGPLMWLSRIWGLFDALGI